MFQQFKRPNQGMIVPTNKRQRGGRAFYDKAIVEYGPAKITRKSSLAHPTMRLEGHEAEIYAAKFHPDGTALASAGAERKIYLWNTADECLNYSVLLGHNAVILSLCFSFDGDRMFTSSVDKTIGVWDFVSGARLRRLKGHRGIVNNCAASHRENNLLCSGSDDSSIRIWDCRTKKVEKVLETNAPVTAVEWGLDGDEIFSAGIDNVIKIWDLRKDCVQNVLKGHTDTVTSLAINQKGSTLLSNSMDLTARTWDIRPYCKTESRQLQIFHSHLHNFEKNLLKCCWSPDGSMVSCGSADNQLYVWNAYTTELIYKLPGHQGSVNETAFHPTEPILMSASSDKTIILGEF